MKIKNVHKKFNERQNELRLAIINATVDLGRPFDLEEDKFPVLEKLEMEEEEYRAICGCLIERDGMVVDGTAVNFIYPVSALETNHHVTLEDGRSFTAMCAIDAIGAAFTFRQNTEVRSVCSGCGKEIYIRMKDGKAVEYYPEQVHALSFELGELENWSGSC